ncbi:MAG: hypothetical protein U0694_20675 [Anaerolineae bacterium]
MGLGDGDEVNVQNTNAQPRHRQLTWQATAGKLSSRLSPTNRDSDGDDVPDGADTAPGATSTPIPSITPTLPHADSAAAADGYHRRRRQYPARRRPLSPTPTFTFADADACAAYLGQPAAIPTLTDIVGDNLEGPGQTFIINNSGGNPLIITMVTTSKPCFQVIVPSGLTFPAIAATALRYAYTASNFQVVLKTNQLGTIRGSLIIQSNDPAAPSLVVAAGG